MLFIRVEHPSGRLPFWWTALPGRPPSHRVDGLFPGMMQASFPGKWIFRAAFRSERPQDPTKWRSERPQDPTEWHSCPEAISRLTDSRESGISFFTPFILFDPSGNPERAIKFPGAPLNLQARNQKQRTHALNFFQFIICNSL